MNKVEFKERHIETDVLCVGGGIAGLMGAIRAAEGGARVLVAEKSNVLYSGSGGLGNDHFMCYIPEVHGPDIEPLLADFQKGQQGGLRPRKFIRTWFERSHEIVKLWHQWGIPMKYNGHYEFSGHGFPGDVLTHLHYAGKEQKKILAHEAEKRGAEILNRAMCFDLIHENGMVGGAIGVSTREDEVIVIKAKAVIVSTGSVMRLYPASTPARMFNTRLSPACVGDGRAMAYRAGAELASMEVPMIRCGPKYMAKAGKATWAGVLRDPGGKAVGPFVDKPNNKYGDPVVDVYQDIFIDYRKTGRGPIYMDCDGLSDEDLEYMLFWLRHEANSPLLNHLDEEGIDIRKNPVEFTTYEYELFPRGGILYNERSEASLPGLFAAGDEFFGGISGAAVFGWVAGESAAGYVTGRGLIGDDTIKQRVAESVGLFSTLRERQDGPDWQEANTLLQQLMWDYAGPVRSETLLDAGRRALLRLRQKAYGSMVAANPHELTRALEVLNLIELGELTFLAASERKETRGKHNRVDYPFTNPLLEKLLVVKRMDGRPVMEWREMRRG
jgi:succinate dehydrogenase/fumarate reductase flavoprotein subunit